VEVINNYAKSRQPFLFSVHFNAPHRPWEAPGDEERSPSAWHSRGAEDIRLRWRIAEDLSPNRANLKERQKDAYPWLVREW